MAFALFSSFPVRLSDVEYIVRRGTPEFGSMGAGLSGR